jgi:NADH:ubiquinone oxidoreductase subunit E
MSLLKTLPTEKKKKDKIMNTQEKKDLLDAVILHEYLTEHDNGIPTIAKKLDTSWDRVNRVVNKYLSSKMAHIGRS